MSCSVRLAAVALGSAALPAAATGAHTLPAPHHSPVVIGAVADLQLSVHGPLTPVS